MFVEIDEIDRPVIKVMALAPARISNAFQSPAWPTTVLNRRNMMTPRMVSRLGVNTPPKVPNAYPGLADRLLLSSIIRWS
jgi:hypothetical protein